MRFGHYIEGSRFKSQLPLLHTQQKLDILCIKKSHAYVVAFFLYTNIHTSASHYY